MADGKPARVNGVDGKRLLSFVERAERIDEQRRALGQDMKEVLSEAKGAGFNKDAIRRLMKTRRMTEEEREERDILDSTYQAAVGMEQFSLDLTGGGNPDQQKRVEEVIARASGRAKLAGTEAQGTA
jgi:uncharacterized protein (UPF0335 family)